MSSRKNGKKMEVYTIPSDPVQKKEESVKEKLWHINKEMIRFKLHYFLFMGGLSLILPYISVFARNRIGLSASSLAVVLVTEQVIFVVTKPILGYLADYFNKLKAMICILTIGQIIFFFLLLTIPKIDKGTDNFSNRSFVFPFQHYNFSDLTSNDQINHQTNNIPEEDVSYKVLPSLISVDHLSQSANECIVYTSEMTSDKNNWKSFEMDSLNVSLTYMSRESNVLDLQINSSTSKSSSFCRIYWNFEGDCYLVPCSALKNHSKASSKDVKTSDFVTFQFWLFAFFTASAMTCASALFTLSDTACLESIQKHGGDFGRQRLCGAISWGIICPIGGILNDITDDYFVSFTLMAIILALSLWNIMKLDMVKPHFSQNILKDVGSVLKSKEFISFEISVLLNGISTGFVWFYLMWFLTTIGGSSFLLGVAQAVQCFVGEIPFMFFSGWMIDKIGHFNVLTASLLSYAIRFLWYSLLYNPWLVLPVEWLHGITYGVYYAAVASFAKKSAKPGTEATTQSLLFTTHEGIGVGIGCVLAGIGFDTLGGHKTFLCVSIFSFCGAVMSILLHLCSRCKKGGLVVTPPDDT